MTADTAQEWASADVDALVVAIALLGGDAGLAAGVLDDFCVPAWIAVEAFRRVTGWSVRPGLVFAHRGGGSVWWEGGWNRSTGCSIRP